MKKAQAYFELKRKQEKELNDFPVGYAFSNEQLERALEKIGAKDTSECCTVLGIGDVMKKTDAPKFKAMLKRHREEIRALIQSDEKIAEETFEYEMDNHEYSINWEGDSDVMDALGISAKDLEEWNLKNAWRRARNSHMERFQW